MFETAGLESVGNQVIGSCVDYRSWILSARGLTPLIAPPKGYLASTSWTKTESKSDQFLVSSAMQYWDMVFWMAK